VYAAAAVLVALCGRNLDSLERYSLSTFPLAIGAGVLLRRPAFERAAFLHIADIWEHRQNGHGHDSKPIERILHEGQSLLVQVIKDPIGTKGARLSTQVSLAGRLLVFLPQDSHIGISQRIEDEGERENLREKLQQLLPEGLAGGFIIRTMAETASEREMQNDIEYLTKLWRDLTEKSGTVPFPSLIYQDLNLAQRVLRDMATEETSRILVDSRETFQKMEEFAAQYTQNILERLEHYVGDRPLYDLHGVEDEIQKALARRGGRTPLNTFARRHDRRTRVSGFRQTPGSAARRGRLSG